MSHAAPIPPADPDAALSGGNPLASAVLYAPRDWSMIIIMLAIVAALGFGGAAMMYRRAEASKHQAEVAVAVAQSQRERAEIAIKEANAQRRLAEQLDIRLRQAIAAEDEARAAARAEADFFALPASPAAPPAIDASAPAPVPAAAAAPPGLSPQFQPAPDASEPAAEIDMRSVLAAASKDAESAKYQGKPLAAAAVHSTIGRTYLSLGEYASAADHLRRAVDLRKPVLGEKNADVIKDQQALTRALQARAK